MKKPQKKNQKFIENFFIKKGLKLLVDLSKKKKPTINQMIINEPLIPELDDLYNLYQYVLINKRTTILEFGSGWSSLIFSLALNELKNKIEKVLQQKKQSKKNIKNVSKPSKIIVNKIIEMCKKDISKKFYDL